MLNIEGVENPLFEHSRRFSQGLGSVRIAAGDIIVALDGSGDYDNLEEAINSEKSGSFFLKEGIYILSDKLKISSNTTIRGSGGGTIIQTQSSGSYWIDLNGKNDVLIENLKFKFYCASGTEAPIEIDNAKRITFKNVIFENEDDNMSAIMWTPYGTTADYIYIINCRYIKYSATIKDLFISPITTGIIEGNQFDDLDLVHTGVDAFMNNIIVIGNYFYSITFEAGSNNNVCIGNQIDDAVTDNGTGNQVGYNATF
ncbi:MAG: hypothetical protein DRZ76_02665 [Candidatus Nealsonbacteria bacterium]|nr:MAG: hypothetical protein DRZ76_02665 [Candidatus Nealsonbacteria bacterium]